MIAGTSALAAPISSAGTVLSQPPISTIASNGYARMHSSTSIDMRLRKSIVVGFMRFSPSEMVGNSSGSPPASSTPRFTDSASPRKCRLQLTSSDHGLQMPITGRPASAEREIPSAWIEARWMNPARSAPPNQRALRSVIAVPPFPLAHRSAFRPAA
jgi:hypothetical protein